MAIGKRLKKAREGVDREKLYPLADAIKMVKERAKSKFDETIEIHRNLDGLVELRLGAFLDHLDGVRERIKLLAIDALAGLLQAFSNCHDRYPATSTPIERAEPSTIFMAASTVSQFRSFIFASAISRTWALVTAPALSRPGNFEPEVSLAAFLMKNDIGGVRNSKVNERSA